MLLNLKVGCLTCRLLYVSLYVKRDLILLCPRKSDFGISISWLFDESSEGGTSWSNEVLLKFTYS